MIGIWHEEDPAFLEQANEEAGEVCYLPGVKYYSFEIHGGVTINLAGREWRDEDSILHGSYIVSEEEYNNPERRKEIEGQTWREAMDTGRIG